MFLSAEPHTRTSRNLTGDEGAHWYDANGCPHHTITDANGKKRNTTLRDARKMSLYPSVSAITKMIPNPSLERWKQEQIIEAAIDARFNQSFKDDEYARYVMNQSRRKMVDARAFGSLFHEAVEVIAKTGFMTDDRFDPVRNHVIEYIRWARDTNLSVIKSEFTAVNPSIGYAGQVDMLARCEGKVTLIDFKSQNITTQNGVPPTIKDVNVYKSWAMQLAAYWHADWEGKPKRRPVIMSVIVSSVSPCYPIVKRWSTEEIDEAWALFKTCNRLWQQVKRYNPVKANEIPF